MEGLCPLAFYNSMCLSESRDLGLERWLRWHLAGDPAQFPALTVSSSKPNDTLVSGIQHPLLVFTGTCTHMHPRYIHTNTHTLTPHTHTHINLKKKIHITYAHELSITEAKEEKPPLSQKDKSKRGRLKQETSGCGRKL